MQRLAAVFRRVRLERPCRVRAGFARHAQFAEHRLRFLVSRDDQRTAAIAGAHFLEHRVHVARFRAITDRQFVFRRSDSQRADEHRGERIREFAFEHRPFASDHAVMRPHFAKQKRRIDVRKKYLARIAKIAAAPIQILGHHAEREIFLAQNAPNLPQHFLDANVRARVARAVVSRKEKFQLLAGLPGTSRAKLPKRAGEFDVRAGPRFQDEVHHG